MVNLLAINSLGPVDIIFFVVIAVLIALAVGIYFLIPVLNKKQYQEQRDNLRKREEAFNASVKPTTTPEDGDVTEDPAETVQDVSTEKDETNK